MCGEGETWSPGTRGGPTCPARPSCCPLSLCHKPLGQLLPWPRSPHPVCQAQPSLSSQHHEVEGLFSTHNHSQLPFPPQASVCRTPVPPAPQGASLLLLRPVRWVERTETDTVAGLASSPLLSAVRQGGLAGLSSGHTTAGLSSLPPPCHSECCLSMSLFQSPEITGNF